MHAFCQNSPILRYVHVHVRMATRNTGLHSFNKVLLWLVCILLAIWSISANPLEFNCQTHSTCSQTQCSSQDPCHKGWTQQAWMWHSVEALSALSRWVEASFWALSASRCKSPSKIMLYSTNYCSNKVFILAMKEISKSKTPLIHQVIPTFNIITTALEDSIDNDALPLVICHATLQGYLMLNKYYSLTDESVVYRITMSRFFSFILYHFTYLLVSLSSSTSKMASAVDHRCRDTCPEGLDREV